MSQRICRTVWFEGHVQGVGFRYTARAVARGYRVTGYVRNLPDGRVEIVAEGEAAEVDRFLAAVRDEMAGYIRHVEQQEGPATGAFASFEVRY